MGPGGTVTPREGFAPDYREVAERIAEWYVRFPEGRIECVPVEALSKPGEYWTVRASAFRSASELFPAGVGHSFLAVPGKTPYTRDSELENAETSAAGRALVMAGIPAKQVASEDEIAAKRGSSRRGEGSRDSGSAGRKSDTASGRKPARKGSSTDPDTAAAPGGGGSPRPVVVVDLPDPEPEAVQTSETRTPDSPAPDTGDTGKTALGRSDAPVSGDSETSPAFARYLAALEDVELGELEEVMREVKRKAVRDRWGWPPSEHWEDEWLDVATLIVEGARRT